MLPRDRDGRYILKGAPRPRLHAWATANGLRPGQADALWAALHRKLRSDFAAMPELDRLARERLTAVARLDVLRLESVKRADDGACKLVFQTDDGAAVESVLIPGRERATLCVSSQVGCAMNCQFCLTATMGLARNLLAAEIVDQLILARRQFPDVWISNVVFMGMGEPLLNYDSVIRAANVITDPDGPQISKRRVTISTCGIVPALKDLARDTEIGLAVSLNAPDDETRSAIMPVNRKYPLADLLAALREYELPNRRRITVEYVLIKGVNDSPAHARRLIRALHGLRAKVNLIPFNPWPGCTLEAPDPADVAAFEARLRDSPYTVMLRKEKGRDILAACGQLAGGMV